MLHHITDTNNYTLNELVLSLYSLSHKGLDILLIYPRHCELTTVGMAIHPPVLSLRTHRVSMAIPGLPRSLLLPHDDGLCVFLHNDICLNLNDLCYMVHFNIS